MRRAALRTNSGADGGLVTVGVRIAKVAPGTTAVQIAVLDPLPTDRTARRTGAGLAWI